ncbi:hypothetical protein ACOMHN_048928 [Nucella lapillus]
MDCPGLFDTHSSHEDVATTILEALSSMDPGPDVIAYVIEIGSYTEEEFSAYRRLTPLMDNVTDYVMIIMTHEDRLKGKDIWQKLQQAPARLQTVLHECGHRVIAFDNSTSQHRKSSQLKYILRETRKLKEQNHHQPYTLELDGDAEYEAERRCLGVEKTENRQKRLVKQLIGKEAQAQQTLVAEREKWARKREEGEESLKRTERKLKEKMMDLSERLDNQKDLNQELEEEVESLEEQLRDQRWAQARY